MKQRISDKLRDRGGVTILMALLAMLVASMVCIVILGAAVTTVKQAEADQDQEQNTLALQSAGELVLSEVKKTGTISFVGTMGESGTVKYDKGTCVESSFSNVLAAAAYETLSGSSGEGTFTINAQASDDSLQVDYNQTVDGSFILKPKPTAEESANTTATVVAGTPADKNGTAQYELIVTLSTQDPSRNSPQYLFLKFTDCKRTVTIVEKKKTENGAESTYYEYNTTFTMSGARFMLAGEAN